MKHFGEKLISLIMLLAFVFNMVSFISVLTVSAVADASKVVFKVRVTNEDGTERPSKQFTKGENVRIVFSIENLPAYLSAAGIDATSGIVEAQTKYQVNSLEYLTPLADREDKTLAQRYLPLLTEAPAGTEFSAYKGFYGYDLSNKFDPVALLGESSYCNYKNMFTDVGLGDFRGTVVVYTVLNYNVPLFKTPFTGGDVGYIKYKTEKTGSVNFSFVGTDNRAEQVLTLVKSNATSTDVHPVMDLNDIKFDASGASFTIVGAHGAEMTGNYAITDAANANAAYFTVPYNSDWNNVKSQLPTSLSIPNDVGGTSPVTINWDTAKMGGTLISQLWATEKLDMDDTTFAIDPVSGYYQNSGANSVYAGTDKKITVTIKKSKLSVGGAGSSISISSNVVPGTAIGGITVDAGTVITVIAGDGKTYAINVKNQTALSSWNDIDGYDENEPVDTEFTFTKRIDALIDLADVPYLDLTGAELVTLTATLRYNQPTNWTGDVTNVTKNRVDAPDTITVTGVAVGDKVIVTDTASSKTATLTVTAVTGSTATLNIVDGSGNKILNDNGGSVSVQVQAPGNAPSTSSVTRSYSAQPLPKMTGDYNLGTVNVPYDSDWSAVVSALNALAPINVPNSDGGGATTTVTVDWANAKMSNTLLSQLWNTEKTETANTAFSVDPVSGYYKNASTNAINTVNGANNYRITFTVAKEKLGVTAGGLEVVTDVATGTDLSDIEVTGKVIVTADNGNTYEVDITTVTDLSDTGVWTNTGTPYDPDVPGDYTFTAKIEDLIDVSDVPFVLNGDETVTLTVTVDYPTPTSWTGNSSNIAVNNEKGGAGTITVSGVGAGDKVIVKDNTTGKTVTITVPAGTAPGSTVTLDIPANTLSPNGGNVTVQVQTPGFGPSAPTGAITYIQEPLYINGNVVLDLKDFKIGATKAEVAAALNTLHGTVTMTTDGGAGKDVSVSLNWTTILSSVDWSAIVEGQSIPITITPGVSSGATIGAVSGRTVVNKNSHTITKNLVFVKRKIVSIEPVDINLSTKDGIGNDLAGLLGRDDLLPPYVIATLDDGSKIEIPVTYNPSTATVTPSFSGGTGDYAVEIPIIITDLPEGVYIVGEPSKITGTISVNNTAPEALHDDTVEVFNHPNPEDSYVKINGYNPADGNKEVTVKVYDDYNKTNEIASGTTDSSGNMTLGDLGLLPGGGEVYIVVEKDGEESAVTWVMYYCQPFRASLSDSYSMSRNKTLAIAPVVAPVPKADKYKYPGYTEPNFTFAVTDGTNDVINVQSSTALESVIESFGKTGNKDLNVTYTGDVMAADGTVTTAPFSMTTNVKVTGGGAEPTYPSGNGGGGGGGGNQPVEPVEPPVTTPENPYTPVEGPDTGLVVVVPGTDEEGDYYTTDKGAIDNVTPNDNIDDIQEENGVIVIIIPGKDPDSYLDEESSTDNIRVVIPGDDMNKIIDREDEIDVIRVVSYPVTIDLPLKGILEDLNGASISDYEICIDFVPASQASADIGTYLGQNKVAYDIYARLNKVRLNTLAGNLGVAVQVKYRPKRENVDKLMAYQIVAENSGDYGQLRGIRASWYDRAGTVMMFKVFEPGYYVIGEDPVYFDDIGEIDWARPSINSLAARKILNGMEEFIFNPDTNVTREQFVKMLVLAFDVYNSKAATDFADVPENSWQYPYIASAERAGIVSGYDNEDGSKTFEGGKTVTRQEMVTMTSRACDLLKIKLKAGTKQTFADEGNIAEYARAHIEKLQSAGIVSGMPDGGFHPEENSHRAQAAKMIDNLYSYIVKNMLKAK